ncbi:MAG TPA: molybdopterin cofactor-binding domain-containing protein [Methylibium sp.]
MSLSVVCEVSGWSRRRFLKSSALAAGGFMLSATWRVDAAQLVGAAAASPREGEIGLNAWVRIQSDNTVTVVVSQAEIGQGISTTLPAVLVDELGADWSTVRLETAPYDPAYANPRYKWMFTGNSESIQAFYDLMRSMGASARAMLLAAASERFAVPVSELKAERSFVEHAASGRRASFGELATAAARQLPPDKPQLKSDSSLTLIGKPLAKVDVPSKVDGSAIFGIDFRVPGMLHAAVRTAPAFGARLELRNRDALLKEKGVRAVLPITGGFAVVADSYWHARSAMLKAEIDTVGAPQPLADSAALREAYRERLEHGPFATPVHEGEAARLLADGSQVIEHDYENPFLAHATMEPMNCVAQVSAERCIVWGPLQGQNLAWYALQGALGLKGEQVEVHRTPYAGGGFGRRLLPDFVVQAALLSKAVQAPVKLIWDREEDLRRDFYRPASMQRLKAALGLDGLPQALAARVVSPTIITPVAPFLAETIQKSGVDPSAMEGMTEWPYAIEHRQVEFHLMQVPMPTSVLRTTGYGPNTFALESFVDELAHAAGQDPIAYRRRLLQHQPRSLRVLDRAAQLAGWGGRLRAGEGRGVAFTIAFGTVLAQVVEVHVSGAEVKVLRVVSVADPGRVLDPRISAAGIEGGVVFGLAGCKAEVSFADGAIVQNNFHQLAMPYLAESPQLVTEFMQSDAPLGGIGEVSPVTLPAALANAIFSATGRRLRSMPLPRHGLQLA